MREMHLVSLSVTMIVVQIQIETHSLILDLVAISRSRPITTISGVHYQDICWLVVIVIVIFVKVKVKNDSLFRQSWFLLMLAVLLMVTLILMLL